MTYVALAYCLAAGILGAYVVSVVVRRRAVEREIGDLDGDDPERPAA